MTSRLHSDRWVMNLLGSVEDTQLSIWPVHTLIFVEADYGGLRGNFEVIGNRIIPVMNNFFDRAGITFKAVHRQI